MKKYLFIGDVSSNTGPSNVNKGIVDNLTDSFCFVNIKNKVLRYIVVVFKILVCKAVIVSGLSKNALYSVKLAKKLKKKTIYISHGCYVIEANLNDMDIDEKNVNLERQVFETVDLVLAVSNKYAELVQKQYSVCEGKTDFLYNGVNVIASEYDVKKKRGSIISVGGDRKLKNNITIAKAMDRIDTTCFLTVYGHIYNKNELNKRDNIKYGGLIDQQQLYEEMAKSELFVLNSIYEPFSLSIFDALQCGCSILVTREAGALEVLDIEECDVIDNPMDEIEISKKIEYLLNNPNNKRIISSIDFEKISFKHEVDELEKKCRKLCNM